MRKKYSIDDVLSELDFSKSEKQSFKACIKAVKLEQSNESINGEDLIRTQVESVAKQCDFVK